MQINAAINFKVRFASAVNLIPDSLNPKFHKQFNILTKIYLS